jgi:hypothetical protein
MPERILCGNCGEPVTTDDPGGDPTKRTPCPKCASTSRAFQDSAVALAKATCEAYDTFAPYPEALLQVARGLIDEMQYGVAIIVMHMACEISADRALREAFRNRGIAELEEPVVAFMSGFNLATTRIRDLYNALTGRNIQSERFWMKFTESANRRNSVAHGGKIATKSEAEGSYAATSALVAYLK